MKFWLFLASFIFLGSLFLLGDCRYLWNLIDFSVWTYMIRESWVLLYDRKVLDAIITLHELLVYEPLGLFQRAALKVLKLLLGADISICHLNHFLVLVHRREHWDRMVLVWMVVWHRVGNREADHWLVLATRRHIQVYLLHVRLLVDSGATLGDLRFV